MAAPILLPTLVQNIVLNPAGVKGGASAYTRAMVPVNKTTTAATGNMVAMSSSLNTLAFRAQTTGRILLTKLGLPLAAVSGLAIKSFVSFEQSMVKIEALVGVSAGGVERFAKAVKESAAATGRGPQELADAMFFVASAGLRGAAAVGVLEASAKGAAIGLGKTAVVADAATSAVNAYGVTNLDGAAAVDVLTAAVREGKVEADRLAPAIGKAIPVASAMGIEFHEVAAAIAAMTRTGTDARTSAIQLRQIMQSLLDPSRQATKAMKEMGIAEGELRRQAREEGLLAVLKRLRDLANENEEAFADVFPNIRALAGALDITGANLTENEGIFRRLADSAGDTDEALNIVKDTAQFKLSKSLKTLSTAFIDLGEAFLPLLDIAISVIGAVTSLAQLVGRGGIAGKALAGIAILVTVVAVGFGTLLTVMGTVGTMFIFAKAAMAQYAATSAAATAQGTLFNASAVGTAGAMTGVAVTTTTAARAMVMFGLATKAALIGTGIGVALVALGLIASHFFKMGKESRSAAREMHDLVDELDDIRLVGDAAITPILRVVDALRQVGAATEGGRIAENFRSTFDTLIADAKKISDDVGLMEAEEALLIRFFSAGDNTANREALDRLINQFRLEFGASDFFSRLFTGFEGGMDEAVTVLLSGSDQEAIAATRVGLWSERMFTTAQKTILAQLDDWEDFVGDVGPSMTPPTFEEFLIAEEPQMGGLAEALEKPVGEFVEALGSRRVDDALFMYESMMENITSQAVSMGVTQEEAAAVMEAAWINSLGTVSQFNIDDLGSINSVSDLFLAVADDTTELSKQAFGGMNNIKMLAEHFAQAAADPRFALEISRLEGQERELALFKEAVRLAKKQEQAFLAIDDAAEQMGETVGSALATMETGFETADAASRELTKRFDNIIGRAFNLDESFTSFNDGLQDMANSLRDSGGAMDQFSEAGRKSRSSLRDQLEGALEYSEGIIEAGGSVEEAEAQFQSFLGAIEVTALQNQVDPNALKDIFRELNITPENISLLFVDDKETASEELLAAAERMANRTQNFIDGKGLDIGVALMEGVGEGLIEAEPVLVATAERIFENMIRGIKTILGIRSPSVRFAKEIGQPITHGIASGILEDKSQIINAVRDLIEDAISVARTRTGAVSRALTSVFDMEDARLQLKKAEREFGAGGITTKREGLTRTALQSGVADAERSLRLGQGRQADLRLSLLDAQEALADFDAAVGSGSPVGRAQIALMDAGQEAANAQAAMRMEGDKAIEMFKNLADTMGLSVDETQTLIDMDTEGDNIFEKMFSPEIRRAIKEVGEGLHDVNKEVADLAAEEAANAPVTFAAGGVIPGSEFSQQAGSPELARFLEEFDADTFSLGVLRTTFQDLPPVITDIGGPSGIGKFGFTMDPSVIINITTTTDDPVAMGETVADVINPEFVNLARMIGSSAQGGIINNNSTTPTPSLNTGRNHDPSQPPRGRH